MTDQTPAPAMQEAVRDAIRKAYDDGYNDAKMAPDNCSTYCVERAVRLDSAALLSKLRAPVADESPMAKMADALREKARQEQQAYQDRRNQATEWGPMPEGTEADRPIPIAPVAHVAGDETSRYLEWAKDRSAWEMPVGTPVYYAAPASAPVADAAPEYAYSDDGKTVTMTNADRAPSYRESAPVADDVQAMLKDPATVHVNMCRGIIAPITFDMLAHVLGDEATAAWLESRRASAPVAGDVAPPEWADRFPKISDMGRLNEAWRAASRSAPVAGEATYYAVMHAQALFGIFETETAAGDCIAKALYPKVMSIRPLYAAPQASEAVRDAGIAASEGVALPKPIQYSPDDGPERQLWKDGWNDCVRHAEQLRAALSAQPGAQKKGESDAG